LEIGKRDGGEIESCDHRTVMCWRRGLEGVEGMSRRRDNEFVCLYLGEGLSMGDVGMRWRNWWCG
jgi:hypothetical protein